MATLYGNQLSFAMIKNSHTKEYFLGVFPSDKLPKSVKLPCALIINTDPAHLPGQHWIAIFIDAFGIASYFDSFGLKPNISKVVEFLKRNSVCVEYNNTQLQAITSSVCGQYCAIFLLYMTLTFCSECFLTHFTMQYENNDEIIEKEFNRIFQKQPVHSMRTQYCVCPAQFRLV
jgi:hypothetical protein